MIKTGTIAAAILFSIGALSAQALTYATNDATLKQSPHHGHLAWNGEIAEYIYIPADGLYDITVRAAGMPMGGGWPKMALRLNFVSMTEVTVNTAGYKNYTFSQYLTEGMHAIGAAFLNDASNASEDRNLLLETISVVPSQGGGNPVLGAEQDWEASAQKRDQEVLVNTGADIAQNRMSPAAVLVVDQHGNPVSNAQVTVTQTSQEFLFGCNTFTQGVFSSNAENDAYNNQFKALFNYATIPFYWNSIEPVDGQPNYALQERMVAWCEANNIAMKGHAVLYGDPAFVPAWAGGVPSVQRQLDHVTDVFARFNGSIDYWDLVNEPFNAPGMDFDAAYFHANGLAQNDVLVVNSYGQFNNRFDTMFGDGHSAFHDYMSESITAGVPFDAIGLQAHAPLDTAFRLDLVKAHLDRYARLEKDIHITEFSPASNGTPVLGSPWRGTWTEAAQAQFAEDFYRVAFAHPQVKAITWWDFADIGAWLPGGGLLRANLTAKPAYNALLHLIREEWMTNTAGAVNNAGEFAFNGFHGDYDVTVQIGSESQTRALKVTASADNTLTVTVTTEGEETPADTTAPVIVMLGSPVVTVEVHGTYADAGATATDDTDGNLSSAITVSNTVDTHKTGLYTVDYNVQDQAGNAAAPVSRMVWITDSTRPVITLNGGPNVTTEAGKPFSDPGASAQDNYDATVTVTVSGTVNTAVLGAKSLTYNASDSAGNPALAVTRTVNVADTKAPTLALKGAASMAIAINGAFTDPGVTATDSFDGNLAASVVVSGSVNPSKTGSYVLTYRVSDHSGNSATPVTRTVSVGDNIAPVITRNGAAVVTVNVGTGYVDAGATASDNYDPNVSVTTSGSVNVNTLGTYTITYTAKDSSGNNATAVKRTVKVVDTTAPVVTLSGGATISLTEGDSFTDPGAQVSDNHDANVSLVVTGSVNVNAPGVYTLTYVATDSSGNTSQVQRTVTVVAKEVPPAPQGTYVGLIGDVDNNGVIDSWDASLVYYLNVYGTSTLNNLLKRLGRNPAVPALADVDQNGVVNSWDHQVISFVLTNGLTSTNDILAANGQPLAHVGEGLWQNNTVAKL